jgi:hypothetical protein
MMGLVKCEECGCDLTPDNFHEVERIKTGEEIAICTECYNGFVKSGRLKHVDEDGNRTCGNLHIYRGTNVETKPWPHPCPNCGSATYLGVFIPTVLAMWADYHGWSYQCYNQSCDPVYDDFGDVEQCGAYWDSEDEYYYTPQAPRL